MQQRQGNILQSLRTVKDFLDLHADRLPGIATGAGRKKLDDAIARVESCATTQRGTVLSTQTGTKRTRSLASRLRRKHMAAIARVARGELPLSEELLPLRLPLANAGAEQLAVAAKGMAKAAKPYESVFVNAGLAVDFIAQLEGAADAMLASIDERSMDKARLSGATTGLRAACREARNTVGVLDVLVRDALQDDADLLRTWRRAIHVQRSRVAPAPAELPESAAA